MWDGLGKHLRAGLVLSIIMVVGAAVASFTLSFLALREVAGNHVTGWGQSAWVFPVCIDFGLLGCEIVLLTLSMMTNTGLQQLLAAAGMLMFGVLTVYYNATRVPPAWRAVTAAPPVAGIILTLVFAMLLKAFAHHTGVAWKQQGRPPAYGYLGSPGGPIQGAVWRPEQYGYPLPPGWAPYGQMPSSTTSANPQNGHAELDAGEAAEAKRAMMRAYLGGLRPDAAGRATGSSIVRAMKAIDVSVSEREARRVLDEYKATQNGRR